MRNKILIVDDEEVNRAILGQVFEKEYEILMAENGQEAIRYANRYRNDLAVILLDLLMPVVDGYQVLQVLHAEQTLEKIPVILITANTDQETALKCYSLGVTDIFNKPFVIPILRQRVLNAVEMYQSREHLQKLLDRSNRKLTEREHQLEDFYNHLIEAVSDIVEFRDVESGAHIKRVKGLTRIMAESYMKLYPDEGFTREWMKTVVEASALHDIGKIAIPDHILLKPGRLTDEEREIMQAHTTKGCDILSKLETVQDTEHYKAAYEIARYHHERYDGRGYPDGLVGDEIPLCAQLVSVVDVYDALVCKRVYKKAFEKEQAFHMIMNGECGTFNPKILKCFESARSMIELLSDSLAEKE